MPPGPPLGQKGAAYADVASANSTLNTLMPGKQKPWMTNTPVQPSPRRPRPQDSGLPESRQSTVAAPAQPQSNQQTQLRPHPEPEPQARSTLHQPQQAPSTPANVLPSPAPSDEPSPAALSNYKDSPNPQTLSLATVSRVHLNTASAPALEPVPTNSSMLANHEVLSFETVGAEPASPEQAVLGALAQAVRSPRAMPPPDLPNGNIQNGHQNGASQGGAFVLGTGSSRPDTGARTGSAGAQEHQNKRRRVEATGMNITFAELAASIDMRIAQIGGHDKLTKDVEGPRFALLKDACAKGDLFYLHLHSLYCLWSFDLQSLPPALSQDLDATHRGFSIVETVLKNNSGFTQDNLAWCAAFPRNSFNEDDPEGVHKVANFLAGLSQYWPTLSPACLDRHYPYLVDELLGLLQCYSVCMQNILFTASRRRLGIPDGYVGEQVQGLFRLDQQQHMDEQGSFRQVILSQDQGNLERRNLKLIRAYRDIWSKVKSTQEERSNQGDQRRQGQLCQQEHQRATMQQAAQQNVQRGQLQQVYAIVHQQPMPNSQAMLNAQQQSQMANQMRLEQVQRQSHRGHTGSPGQQQINPQWVQSQMQGTVATHARRSSLNTHQQIAQPAAQFGQRPQSSGAFSAVRSPINPQTSFAPHNMAPQFSQVSPNFVLPSNSPTSPTMPGAAHSQYQYSKAQQQQPTLGQNQVRLGSWLASTPSPTTAQSPQISAIRPATPSVSPHMGGQQPWGRPQPRAGSQSQTMQPQISQSQMVQQPMGQQQISQHQMIQHQMIQQQMVQQQMVQQQMVQQQMRQQQMRQQSGQQRSRQLQVDQLIAQRNMQLKRPLVPPRGHVIDRSEHPHSHQEKKSLLMSLHQAHARSPDRTRRNSDADERYYQSVHSLAVQPLRLTFYHEVTFEVSLEQYSQLCKQKTLPQITSGAQNQTRASLPVREYCDGSLRFRVRCCRLRSDKGPVQESDWVTKDMLWPDHIFVHVNEQKLTIRRGTHNGKDLPIELTDFILAGTNKLKVAVPRAGPTAAGRAGNLFLAIEIIKISSHTALLKKIESNNRVGREETLEKIRTRVEAAPDEDDEIAVIDRSGSTARELSISMTDPFSASIFKTPARGATCTHLECFDLHTWLTTRPTKQQIKCGHKDVCTCAKRLEPTEPDKWKCPICFEDARPSSLRIDSFLEDVRKQLEERNQLDTKSILVAADGTWRPVDEPDDEDDEGSDGDGPARAARRSMSTMRKSAGPNDHLTPVERGRAPVEIIELD